MMKELQSIGICSAIGLTLVAGCARTVAQPSAVPPKQGKIPVESLIVESQLSQASSVISGQLEPYRIATVTAEVGARVLELPLQTGTKLSAGSLLSQLDDSVSRAGLAEAVAGLAQAKAGRQQAEAELARARVETDAARQAARAQLAQAEAGQQGASAQARQAAEGERKARAATRAQELAQAAAGLAQAQAEERLARTERDRIAFLLKEGVVGQQAHDRVQATFEMARARCDAAEQQLSLAREGARQEDIRTATAQVAQASAGVASFQAQKDAATAQLRIAGTRPARLEALQRQIDGLHAQEARASATVRQAELLVKKHRIGAPFGGRVLAKLTESGQTVAPGTPIARLGELSRLKATFALTEAARLGFKPGQAVSLTVDAFPGKRFTGKVATVGYQADPRIRTFGIEVELANPGEVLLPNMVARLAVKQVSPAPSITIPISALATERTQAYVFVLTEGIARRREVKLGPVQGDQVTVQEGLKVGESLAATPQRLTEGARVEILGGKS